MKRTKKTRTTETIVERDQVLVIKRLEGRASSMCAACGNQSRMVTVDEAASIARVSARTIYRRVEESRLHFAETPEGRLLICLNSLLNVI
jgi:hypothetical protein